MRYDVLIVLGYKLTNTFTLPEPVFGCLQKAKQLYAEHVIDKIIVSGKWSIQWDFVGITPPITEASLMKGVLISGGISLEDIYLEEESKDTIGNAYFCKKRIIEPHRYKRIVVVCQAFHAQRVAVLFHLIFGAGYTIDIVPVIVQKNRAAINENEILQEQLQFLSPMKEGDDSFLQKRLYHDPYYTKQFVM